MSKSMGAAVSTAFGRPLMLSDVAKLALARKVGADLALNASTPGPLALVAAILVLGGCSTQPQVDPLTTLSGMELYLRLCSSCHGVEGKGDGHLAPIIKIGVPDLTGLASRHGGEFPLEDVRRAIDGRFADRAHGSRDMPVWGWQLYDVSNTDDAAERARTDSMIQRLAEYLRSIQR